MQQPAIASKGTERHGVRVIRQVFIQQEHVARPVKGHAGTTAKLQLAAGQQRGNARFDAGGVYLIGPLTHQPHDHRAVAAMAHAGG